MAQTFALDYPQGNHDVTIKEAIFTGTITFSGNYPAGGDTLALNVKGLQSNAVPNRVEIYEQPASTQTATGYQFIYKKGTTLANGVCQINSTEGTQFTTGAYGTAFANTVIKARVWVPLGQ